MPCRVSPVQTPSVPLLVAGAIQAAGNRDREAVGGSFFEVVGNSFDHNGNFVGGPVRRSGASYQVSKRRISQSTTR